MTIKSELITQFSEQFSLTEHQVINTLSQQKSWESRYRALMLLGKELKTFPVELQNEQNLVQGCESKVWLHTEWNNKTLVIAASSDAKIVKGLVAVVIAAAKGKTAQQIIEFDIDNYFEKLNLLGHLSPSRVNGVMAIIKDIKNIASINL